MEQAQSEKSELVSGEGENATAPHPPAGSTPVPQPEANEAKRALPPRRKLSDEQEGEMTRLYADTTMPVSEIARMFGIGESSVYRLAQRHGAALRGKQTPPGVPPAKPAAGAARGRPGARAATPAAKPSKTRLTPARATVLGRFRIRFLAERVVQARDVRDALRQAESFDAIEVTAVMHED
jgi:transposase-like protein